MRNAQLRKEIMSYKAIINRNFIDLMNSDLEVETLKKENKKLISDQKSNEEKLREEIMTAERQHDSLWDEFHAFATKLLEGADTQEELQFIKENAPSIIHEHKIANAFEKKMNSFKNRDLKEYLECIDGYVSDNEYLLSMNRILRKYANIEHDALDILKRKKALPNALFVFRSILAIENVHLYWLED